MRYFTVLLLLFPFIEIYTLISVGGSIGAFNSVLLIIITGALGLFLLRNQGLKALLTLRSRETAFEPTPDNILKNLFTPIGGFFLLIPGFLTDILGLLILLPPTRIIIIGYIFFNEILFILVFFFLKLRFNSSNRINNIFNPIPEFFRSYI